MSPSPTLEPEGHPETERPDLPASEPGLIILLSFSGAVVWMARGAPPAPSETASS